MSVPGSTVFVAFQALQESEKSWNRRQWGKNWLATGVLEQDWRTGRRGWEFHYWSCRFLLTLLFFFFLIAPSFNLEKAMATHPSTLASKIPWMEEPGRLQSMGSRRGGHDWATSLSPFTFMHWRRKWQSTPVFLPGEFQGRGAWWAAIYGVIQSRTRLKRLSSSSSSFNLPISLPQV